MTQALYQRMLNTLKADTPVKRVQLGLNWTAVHAGGIGLCFSPVDVTRTLTWPGTLSGRNGTELASWLLSWNTAEAAVGLATLNAITNRNNPLCRDAVILRNNAPGHLRVFEHFRPLLGNASVIVIGHYPGLDQIWSDLHYRIIEKRPQAGDLPDTAAEWLLPDADWVFISASSIANKSVGRLLALAHNAKVVLMGPSLPWLDMWYDYGVDYLAGINVVNTDALWQVVAEGGGTRLFAGAVEYALLPLTA